jgi:transcriptional regulator with XRE-family HTH domain
MFLVNLKSARERTGLNQKDFAESIGLSRTRYHNYESGKREPDNDTLLLIAEGLSVTPNYLLGIQDPPTVPDPDDEIWELRREMAERPEMKTLFSLAKSATTEDINFANDMLRKFKRDSGYGDE